MRASQLVCKVKIKWIETTDITEANVGEHLAGVDGIIVPGGFGTRGTEGKIACVRYAREKKIPYLGLCLGFQMAVIEFARNVCGLTKANSTEIDPACPEPVIDILPEQKKIEGLGGNMRLGGRDVELKPETLAWQIVRARRSRCGCGSVTAMRWIRGISRRWSGKGWSFRARRRSSRSCRSWNCRGIRISSGRRRIRV